MSSTIQIQGGEKLGGFIGNQNVNSVTRYYNGIVYDPDRDGEIQYDGDGMNVVNILRKPRSHPDMEAKFGKLVYKAMPRENDPNVAKREIEELKAQMAVLIAQSKASEAPAPAETSAKGELSYTQLLAIAKRIDPTIKTRLKKEELIEIVYGKQGE